jgi:ATP-dependent phosphofructokinase / diphosphate-dependent phosphofructokinase
MRIGILTGGGDCPGLNAAIRAVVRKGCGYHGNVVIGFRNGWQGVLDGNVVEMTPESTRGILHRGGTILGTSRTDPFRIDGGLELVKENLATYRIAGLIVVGGEGTLSCAARMSAKGVNVVGVPKTIDNDIGATDLTFGFDTALQIATDAIDRLHSTAESHNRVMILEVMGRHAGWIALYAGMAGGADALLIPEHPFDIDEVCQHLRSRHTKGHTFSIVVVSEGAVPKPGTIEMPEYEKDRFGRPKLGGISYILAEEVERRTGFESRVTILGHVQRGGSPTALDRILATRFGVAAVDAASEGRWGTMVALRGTDVREVPIQEAIEFLKTVPEALYEVAEVFFG